jgi:hypothetical protein
MLNINVNDKTEKKGALTYLSWAWAWAEVLKHDPGATWQVHTYGPPEALQPCMWVGETAMVHTSVTVKGLTRQCMLPVMDNKNNAVKLPDARKISDAIMRCMTKACSMHGLGLYIYAGEDLPEEVPIISATAEAFKNLPPEIQSSLRRKAHDVERVLPDVNQAMNLINMIVEEWPDADEQMVKAGLWHLLDSKTRSAIKRMSNTSAV